MKWAALGLGAAVLAVGVGAFALTNRAETQNVAYASVPEPSSSVPLRPSGTADVLQPTPAPPRSAAKPTSTEPCDDAGDEKSDCTGDDDSSSRKPDGSCRSDDENENENENENESWADDQAGDKRSVTGGESRNDEAGDEQAGENDNGD